MMFIGIGVKKYWSFFIFYNVQKCKLDCFFIKLVSKTPQFEEQYTNNNKYWFSKIF